MFEQFINIGPLLRIQDDHSLEEVNGLSGETRLEIEFDFVSIFEVSFFLKLSPGAKGQILMKHLIDEYAQGPDISFVIVNVVTSYLGSHVEQISNFCSPPSDLVAEAQVDYFNVVLASYQDVVCRKVPMDVSIVVDLLQPQQHLVSQISHFLLAQLLFVECRPNPDASVLHQQQYIFFGLLVIVQLDDIRVLQGIEGVDLILNPAVLFLKRLFRNLLLVDDFEGVEALMTLNDFNFAERLICRRILDTNQFLEFDLNFAMFWNVDIGNGSNVHISYLYCFIIGIQMKAGKDKELDYLLINLCEQPQKPNREEAKKHQQKHSLRKQPWTLLGTQQYHRFGPGVSLYFTLLKYLIFLFAILFIVSLPTLIVNLSGSGLSLYGNSFGQGLMKISLANQPSLEFKQGQLIPEQQMQKIDILKRNQIILITFDLISSFLVICFVIFWRIKSEDLISEMVKKEALPSYHTVIVELPSPHVSQDQLRTHFQQFGDIKQIQFVYNYKSFLLQMKQFIEMVERYSDQQDPLKQSQLYDQINQQFLRIKQIYKSATENNVAEHQLPFSPTRAFVVFQDSGLAQRIVAAYRYQVNNVQLALNDSELKVAKCQVEPLSILWENFHLPAWSQTKRSWLFGVLVALILMITLFSIFLMSLHTGETSQELETADQNQIDFSMAVNSTDPKIVNAFCSGLTYKTFQWRFYSLCQSYFSNFQHHWAFVLSVSGVIVGINLFLIKIVFALAELRRFRTLPEKKRFLTLSIFLTYFFSSSLLGILIRGEVEINGQSWSLVAVAQSIFPSVPSVQVYSQAGRKWYMHIGKLLLVNYILALNICPWLYVIQEWILQKAREVWSLFARTQKQAKKRILDRQFYWQFYYAVQLNAIFFGLIFSIALPIFNLLTLISFASLFLTSKIIFHRFTRQPQVYDHKMNSFITQAIIIALLLHQLTSYYFLSVQEIFPKNDSLFLSNSSLKNIYGAMSLSVIIVFFCWKKIATLVRKNTGGRKEQLMMTEQINSSFGAGSRQLKQFEPRVDRKRQKVARVHEIRRDNYLNSYKMQDNPYYNHISYILLLLYQTIILRKEPSLESIHIAPRPIPVQPEHPREKAHQSMNQCHTERILQNQFYETERALNQSI